MVIQRFMIVEHGLGRQAGRQAGEGHSIAIAQLGFR
jgi:hypothetical protein